MSEDNKIISQESVKLNHNTKGYTWEIKLQDQTELEKVLPRLKKIDDELINTYGMPGGLQ